jgi:hypothetical protein
MYNLCFDFHPVESLFIDPELSLHPGQHLGFFVGRLIAWLGCCLQYINVERTRSLLAHELEVESFRHFVHQQVITAAFLFVFGDPLSPLLLRFAAALSRNLFQLLLFLCLFSRR